MTSILLRVRSLRRNLSILIVTVLFGAVAVHADLSVVDSLNRYSMFGRQIVKFGFRANTAAGGWVGADTLEVYGENSIRSQVTAGQFDVYGNADTVWGYTRINRTLKGNSLYNARFDSMVSVRGNVDLKHNVSMAMGLKLGSASVLTMDMWANPNNSFNGKDFPNNQTISFGPGSNIYGVTWNAANAPVNLGYTLPDTAINPGWQTINDGGQDRTWKCGNNSGGAVAGCAAQDSVLPPGKYGDMTVRFGSTMYLGEGVYEFNSLTMQNSTGNPTRLLALQPNGARTVILVKNGLNLPAHNSSAPGVIAPSLYTKGYGIGSNQFAGGTMMLFSEQSTTLNNYTDIWATVVSPRNTIYIKQSVRLYGQIFANRILIDNDFKGTDGAFIPYYPQRPVVKVANFGWTGTEGAAGTTKAATFRLQMDHVNGATVKVWYHTVTPTRDTVVGGQTFKPAFSGDYVPVQSTVSVAPTTTSASFNVTVNGNGIKQPNRYFMVVLDSITNGTLDSSALWNGKVVGAGFILDDDPTPALKVDGVSQPEGTAPGTKDFKFFVSLVDSVSGIPLTSAMSGGADFTWSTQYGTADGSDLTSVTNQVVHWPAGQVSDTLTVKVVQDAIYEGNETFTVRVVPGSAGNVQIASIQARSTATGTILNDDAAPTLTLADAVPVVEGGTARFVAKLSAPSGFPVCFNWNTSDFSARAGSDYVATSGMGVCIPAGATTDTLDVKTLTDSLYEGTESFRVTLNAVTGVNGFGNRLTATGTILDDDPRPGLWVRDTSVRRPSVGWTTLKFVVSLVDSATGQNLTKIGLPTVYDWTTVPGSALADTDFAMAGGTRTLPAGGTTDTLQVLVRGDSRYHPPITFSVQLTAPATASPVASRLNAVGTIYSALGRPLLSVSPTTQPEGDSGKTAFSFTISLIDSATGRPVVSRVPLGFDWTTVESTAKTGVDFLPIDGRGAVAAGKSSVDIATDSVIGNTIHQLDRDFKIELVPVGTDLRPGTYEAVGTIRDDDPAPWVVVDDASIQRDTVAGSRTPMWFHVRLLDPRTGKPATSGLPVSVSWKTLDGTAVAGLDYVQSLGSLTIPVGSSIDSLAVPILGDPRFAPDNSFQVILSSLSGATGYDTVAIGSISGGARKPRLALKGGSVVRPTDSTRTAQLPFAFYLVDPLTGQETTSRQRIDFNWSTFDSTARAGVDFTVVQNAPDHLGKGMDGDTLHVTVKGFSGFAPPRLAGVTAVPSDTTWVSGDLVQARTTGLILDSATNTGRFATADTTLTEPTDSSLVKIVVRLQLAMRDSTVHLPVRVDLAGTTAREKVNFRLVDSAAVFAPGTLYDTIGLMLYRDGIHSGSVKVRLDLLANLAEYVAVTDPSQIDITILDADPPPTISFVDTLLRVRESDTTVSIVIGLDLLSSQPIAGNLVVVGGTARPGIDFEFGNGTFTFPPLTRFDTLPLRIRNDHRYGPDRDVVLGWGRLADSALATFGTLKSRERVVILESDPKPTLSFAQDTVVVNDVLGRVDLKMVLDSLSDSIALADLFLDPSRGKVSGIAMVADSAYAVRIDSGSRETSYRLLFGNDGKVGPDRVVHLVLRNPRGSFLGADSVVVVVIRNTNALPVVKILTPVDSSHTSNPNQRIEWTVDGGRQPPGDTLLREGWNTVSRCYTDTAGNTGCDAHQVWGDFTPPAIRVFKITGPDPLDPAKDTTWWGDKARTRFGKDTVWYWTRDSILGNDGNWHVKAETLEVVTDFSGDGLFPVRVSTCDSVGNCAMDTGWIDLKQSLPVVEITTPPEGSHVVAGLAPVLWRVTDDGRTWSNADVESIAMPGVATITRCYTDDVGNKGCGKRNVVVEPVHAVSSFYVDTDGDGRVDAAVVELDSRWLGSALPSFDFRWGDSLRVGSTPDAAHPFYSGPSRGRPVVVGSDTIYVDVGPYLTDSVGNVLKGPDGNALTGVLGDTAYAVDGKPLRDSLGRVYFKVAKNGQIDSTRFLVPIKPPFAFGMTGFDSTQPARMVTVWSGKDTAGKPVSMSFIDTFKVGDRVPPVVVEAQIHRVENYTAPDTLFVTPSEPLLLGVGRDWLQVGHCPGGAASCDPRDLIWVDVPDTAVKKLPDGRYWFLVPTDSMSIRPDYRVRFRSDVSDTKGNGVDVGNLHWSTLVSGAPRPELVRMTPPTRIPEIPASERDLTREGGILIRATNGIGGESTLAWWEPGSGYVSDDDPRVRSICPVKEYCNGPKVYINRPVRLIVYIYDRTGTYVSSRTTNITSQDIAAMKPDQLDRLTIEFDWNHRTTQGKLVSTGIYLWRIVSYVVVEGRALPAISNQLYKVGVKVEN